MRRACGCCAFGLVAGAVLCFTAVAAVLLFGPDTTLSF
jgi:hypothetical protein